MLSTSNFPNNIKEVIMKSSLAFAVFLLLSPVYGGTGAKTISTQILEEMLSAGNVNSFHQKTC